MTLEVIYVTRHGFRSNWLVDPSNGSYSAVIRSPTGGAADPALTAHGVDQARELGEWLVSANPPIERVYSSLYYRCLQTVEPFVRKTAGSSATPTPASGEHAANTGDGLKIRGETGIGEWYGAARFQHPVPETLEVLETHFPGILDHEYKPYVVPNRMGEQVDELHDRLATALESVIAECDRDGIRAVLLCSHAAPIIALGRALTGNMPEDISTEDFKAFTCGLSMYRRRGTERGHASPPPKRSVDATEIGGEAGTAEVGPTSASPARNADPQIRCPNWRGGRGVSGGWDCVLNSDCSHLSAGEERGWRFSGDESFKTPTEKSILDSGELGVVVEGTGKNGSKEPEGSDSAASKTAVGGSRL
ncbi:hypothetical protein OQA88_238 [Cercophora sp. LCS_1]